MEQPTPVIGKPGFRRWYERQLMEGHAWLVTCFLCGLCVAALLEGLSFRAPGLEPILRLVLAYVGGLVGWLAWSRYRALMAQAQRISEQSSCGACGTAGRFSVQSEPPPWRVRCQHCGHEWRIE